ncbi:unnamed protein product, partial [Discosporangium mesarthrocarpum]
QDASSGGHVHAVVYHATNLQDKDIYQQSGLSDPYIRFVVGSTDASSSTVDESLRPVRGSAERRDQTMLRTVDLGVHNSGDLIMMSLYDADSGLEFGDDLLYTTTLRVPWCSAFHATRHTADCGDGYTYDTSWLMPRQPLCNETSWVNLDGNDESQCTGGAAEDACLLLEFLIVPFQARSGVREGGGKQ